MLGHHSLINEYLLPRVYSFFPLLLPSIMAPLNLALVLIVSAAVPALAFPQEFGLGEFGDFSDPEDNTPDWTDLSHIKKLAAVGDSYSAGIGAGKILGGIEGALNRDSGE